jgi:hypothetical protein
VLLVGSGVSTPLSVLLFADTIGLSSAFHG